MKSSFVNSFPFLFLLSSYSFQTSHSLESIQVGEFPFPAILLTPYYDGSSDHIYFFGGFLQYKGLYFNTYNIFRFSLSTNAVKVVGRIPELPFESTVHVIPSTSTSASNNDSNPPTELYYIIPEFEKYQSKVFTFNLLDGVSTEIGNIPVPLDRSSVVKDTNGDTFFLGGLFNAEQIIKVNLESQSIQYEEVGKLQQSFFGSRTAAIGNEAFIFGGSYSEEDRMFPHITLDLETLSSSDPNSTLPNFSGVPSVTTTATDEIYLLGGYAAGEQPVDGIIWMNGTTQDFEFIPISNIPLTPGKYLEVALTSVYVEKLDRIYFFGGVEIGSYEYLDNIWYIDLN